MRRILDVIPVVLVAIVLGLAVANCGDDDSSGSSNPFPQVNLQN